MCNLLTPIIMILFGLRFLKNPPKERNHWYGYRTRRSGLSRETWNFAQRYMGKIWYKAGWGLVLFAVLGQLLTLSAPAMEDMCMWSVALTTVEIAVMLATIIPVERALKKNFDENGMRQ